jgi:hypothetical protein
MQQVQTRNHFGLHSDIWQHLTCVLGEIMGGFDLQVLALL